MNELRSRMKSKDVVSPAAAETAKKVSTGLLKINERYVNIVTDIGLSVSILFLIVHLVTFFMVNNLRNLPGKNLASFCTALLLEYSSTLLSTVLEGKACFVNEIAAYYFIMASAFWMLTMSYDVWQTVRTVELSSSISSERRKSTRKFLFYSVWSWLMPALFTFLVFFTLPRFLPDFRLVFDEKKCCFRETDTMYIFVETVFGTILLLNTSFFASSICQIYSTQSAVQKTKQTPNNTAFLNHFRLYGRLSLIMGVTWAAEFVIYFSDFDILSVTFRVINTFEGLLIMIAFTCRKEVFDSIRSLHRPCNVSILPLYGYVTLRRL